MENFIYQTLGMSFFLSPDGDDGGNGDGPIKFGGIEVNFDDDPETLKANIIKANKAYKDSSNAGITTKKELDAAKAELEQLKSGKTKNPENGKMFSEEEVKALIKEQMKDVNDIANKGKQFNLEREIEKNKETLRKEFKYLDEDTYNEVMGTVDKTFKEQDSNVRNGAMYKNMAKVMLGEALTKNIEKIDSDVALEKIRKNPEAMKKLIQDYTKEAGIDFNMPEGGFTDQATFETKVQNLEEKFKKERDPLKRKQIIGQITEVQSEGKRYGFKIK